MCCWDNLGYNTLLVSESLSVSAVDVSCWHCNRSLAVSYTTHGGSQAHLSRNMQTGQGGKRNLRHHDVGELLMCF